LNSFNYLNPFYLIVFFQEAKIQYKKGFLFFS